MCSCSHNNSTFNNRKPLNPMWRIPELISYISMNLNFFVYIFQLLNITQLILIWIWIDCTYCVLRPLVVFTLFNFELKYFMFRAATGKRTNGKKKFESKNWLLLENDSDAVNIPFKCILSPVFIPFIITTQTQFGMGCSKNFAESYYKKY